MPLVFAGARIDCDHRVAVDVRSGPVAAVIVVRRAGDGEIGGAGAGVVGRLEAPHVGTAAILPAIAPGIVIGLTFVRRGVELPQSLAGHDVVAARIACRALRVLKRGRADNHGVARNRRRAAIARAAHRDRAVLAKVGDGGAGGSVERVDAVARRYQDARGMAGIARPIADAAPGEGAGAGIGALAGRQIAFVDPDFLAGGGIERDHPALRREVHDAFDHNRHGGVEGAQGIGPGGCQFGHVAAVNIGQRRIAGGGGIALNAGPVAIGRYGLGNEATGRSAGQHSRGSRLKHRSHCHCCRITLSPDVALPVQATC